MRDIEPLQHAAVAGRLLRRNLIRHRGEAAAGARAERKGTHALCQRTEPAALAVEHFDLTDVTVGIRVEFYGRRRGPAALRHLDNAGGAANPERCLRRGDLHVAGFGNETGNESRGAERYIEGGGVGIAAFLIDELIDGDPGIGRQTEGRLVIEGDAERRVHGGLERIVREDRIGNLQSRGRGIGPRDRGGAVQGRDLTYRSRSIAHRGRGLTAGRRYFEPVPRTATPRPRKQAR